jgi:uncharacterized protein YndB with AHSA1/START domain
MKVVMIIAAVLIVALLSVLILASTRPNSFRLERSIVIHAPPEEIFAQIDDFRAWRAWSPYENLDPNLKRTYGGAARGQGAIYEWAGDNKAGAGRMEIVQATAPAKVVINLDFSKPFVAHNLAEFTLEPADQGTKVTWAMSGPSPFISKAFGLFISMDALVGKDFEKGLASLKTVVEG